MSPRKSAAGRKPGKPNLDSFKGRFGARLRELRLKKFDTLQEFADALKPYGISPTAKTISGWETGYRAPDYELLPVIAEVLNVSVRTLIPAK